ncbi:hypothetical protein AGR4C_pa40025 [Agrobacterium tumefaciens str. Kerr 14]|uniref:Uncharacterized protein n=1 Tax=Agrobacterium tumefaciens str. Kerr 14 TaxID=1183424 RepID=A0A1S7SAF4_AGRTU|nr:hypothetical protein AGR4C_pa40025 [Agrobacterium tumefaciens str. Kerr 14]
MILAEGMGFDCVYMPKKLYFDGSEIKNDLHFHFSRKTVRLFHYTHQRFDGAPRLFSYWSECLTEAPAIAGEATGIGDGECIWRIEWKFPVEKALEYLEIGNVRLCKAGAIREFTNRHEIDIAELSWRKMDAA